MDKLTEANLEQSTVSKQPFVSGLLPKRSIPVFSGDLLQYSVWKSAFNTLVDSRLHERQCGPVVRALALRSGDPGGFKTRSDHSLNLILVVPGSTSQLHL